MLNPGDVGAVRDRVVKRCPVQVEVNDERIAEVGAPHGGAVIHLDVPEVGPDKPRLVQVGRPEVHIPERGSREVRP